MIGYLLDVHVPRAVAEGLRLRGIDALRAQENGSARFADVALLRRATELGRVLVSQDVDLLKIAHEWSARGNAFGGLAFAPQSTAIGVLVRDLESLARHASPAELVSRVVFIPFHAGQTDS